MNELEKTNTALNRLGCRCDSGLNVRTIDKGNRLERLLGEFIGRNLTFL